MNTRTSDSIWLSSSQCSVKHLLLKGMVNTRLSLAQFKSMLFRTPATQRDGEHQTHVVQFKSVQCGTPAIQPKA